VAVAPNAVVVAPNAVAAAANAAAAAPNAVAAAPNAVMAAPNAVAAAQICAQALPCGAPGPHFFHAVPVSLLALALRLCQAELVDRFAQAVRFFPDDHFVRASPGVPVAETVLHLKEVSLALQWASALAVHLLPERHELPLAEMSGWAVRDAGRESYFHQPVDCRYCLALPVRALGVPAGRPLPWDVFQLRLKTNFPSAPRAVDHVHARLENDEGRHQVERPGFALLRQSVAPAIRPQALLAPDAPQSPALSCPPLPRDYRSRKRVSPAGRHVEVPHLRHAALSRHSHAAVSPCRYRNLSRAVR
jgi:hypothetical protein